MEEIRQAALRNPYALVWLMLVFGFTGLFVGFGGMFLWGVFIHMPTAPVGLLIAGAPFWWVAHWAMTNYFKQH